MGAGSRTVPKITKKFIDGLASAGTDYFVWDSGLTGFGVRVQPSGAKSFVVKYRVGSGRGAPSRRLTLGTVGKLTPDEARAIARKRLADVAHGRDPAGERAEARRALTVAALADRFLAEHIRTKRKPNTIVLYEHLVETAITPAFGSKAAVSIAKADVLRMHHDLRDRPFLANRAVAVTSAMFSWAGKIGLVQEDFNPAARIEKYREEGRERFLSTDELLRLGDALRCAETDGIAWNPDATKNSKHAPRPENRRTRIGPHPIAAIRLLLLTGARLREILHLEWTQVDLERGILWLPDSKTGKKALVVGAAALQVVTDLPRLGRFVIASNHPDRPRHDLKKPWDLITRAAELDGLRIHDLRHSYASTGASAGMGLPIIGRLLGHTQARTTQKYAHLADDATRRAANEISDTIAAALERRSRG
jgi:integrase